LVEAASFSEGFQFGGGSFSAPSVTSSRAPTDRALALGSRSATERAPHQRLHHHPSLAQPFAAAACPYVLGLRLPAATSLLWPRAGVPAGRWCSTPLSTRRLAHHHTGRSRSGAADRDGRRASLVDSGCGCGCMHADADAVADHGKERKGRPCC